MSQRSPWSLVTMALTVVALFMFGLVPFTDTGPTTAHAMTVYESILDDTPNAALQNDDANIASDPTLISTAPAGVIAAGDKTATASDPERLDAFINANVISINRSDGAGTGPLISHLAFAPEADDLRRPVERIDHPLRC